MMETFEKWTERMETEFNAKKTGVGLKKWFEKFYTENGDFRTLFKAFTEKKRVGSQIKDFERNFLGTIIAMSFYPSEFNEKSFMTQSRRKKGEKKIFEERGSWGNFLNKVWEGICLNEQATGSENSFSDRLGKPSKETLSVENNSKGDLHWIELCSALQKQCKVFDSLQTLNKFITTAFRVDHPNDLSDYGLYVRDIDDLCIAYGILNSKTFTEIRSLIIECGNIIKNEQKDRNYIINAAQTITQQLETDFNGLIGLDIDIFMQQIKSNAQKFLLKDSDRHWTTIKKIFELFQELNGKNAQQDKYVSRDFNNRISDIYDCFCEYAGLEDVLDVLESTVTDAANDVLSLYISDSLILNSSFNLHIDKYDNLHINDEYDVLVEDKEIFERSLSKLRRMCIVALMKDKRISGDRAEFKVLKEINDKLEELHLRTIDYIDKDEVIVNKTTDKFDWFIVECIKYDKSCAEGDDCISGWYPFCDYMGINEKG